MINLYIIPGFGEKTEDPGYVDIIKYGKEKGYNVVPINPVWDRNTSKKWLQDFDKTLNLNKGDKSVVIGFSFGAYIAALSSKKHTFEKIIFCSLSPYFMDDVPSLPQMAFKVLGKKRMQEFSKQEFSGDTKNPAIFIVGDKDIPLVIDRVKKSYSMWQGSKKLEILPNVEHNINNPLYIKTIEENM